MQHTQLLRERGGRVTLLQRDTSLIRKRRPLRPCSRTLPRALWGSLRGGRFNLALSILGIPRNFRSSLAERESSLLTTYLSESTLIRRTGLAPWEFEFPFSGRLTSTFLVALLQGRG